ncbi:methyltransferase-like protein 27 [Chanos chanos]|uniref:Methyltransferase-like protein 27 n=1 Tax=Chanos chanos TaxID=29144 RepID=A0A6J2W1I9_CHACN|nr:methyltransferase-like protein 27 [Chanos chanos]XP_030638064.1 methyltransferase-like protein 27 [Chanos chanos]
MADASRSFSDVRNVILSAHENTGTQAKTDFYNGWAENYEQDVAILEYQAPFLAAECIATYFKGDRAEATVLDVACGTGLVSLELKKKGFNHFVGVDGSEGMLELARKRGVYQELRRQMLGPESLTAEAGTHDVVVIVGALSVGQVPVGVIRDLWQATKPGGYICMTTRSNLDNREYKAELERVMKSMEEEGKWSQVTVSEVEKWERAVSEQETGYISGAVYLYRRSLP